MRIAAALLVVVGHVRLLFFKDYADVHHSAVLALTYALTSLGGEAVVLFFVLSGYWVGGSILRQVSAQRFTWRNYASARLTRLWLVLIPALVLTLLVDNLGHLLRPRADIYTSTAAYVGVPPHPVYSLWAFLGNILFLQGLHAPEYGLDHPLWSLAYEFWFYLMFPAVLLAIASRRRLRSLIPNVAVIGLGAFVAGPPVLALFAAWLTGALAAFLAGRAEQRIRGRQPGRLGLARGCSLVLTVAAMLGIRLWNRPLWEGSMLVAAPAALLLGLLSTDLNWVGARGRLLRAVSSQARYSYSLYAIHLPLAAFACAVFGPRVVSRWPLDPVHALLGAGLIASIMVVAALFAKLTEGRTRALRALLSQRRRPPPPVASEPSFL